MSKWHYHYDTEAIPKTPPKRRSFKFKLRCLLLWDKLVRLFTCGLGNHEYTITSFIVWRLLRTTRGCKRCGKLDLT